MLAATPADIPSHGTVAFHSHLRPKTHPFHAPGRPLGLPPTMPPAASMTSLWEIYALIASQQSR